MAAGDLENILMTDPDSTMHSSRVRNIIWRDNNNVNRSVKYVYWCPNGVTAKLVWQRDHSPVVDKYTNLNNSVPVLFEWTCPTGTTSITSLSIYVDNAYSSEGLNRVCSIWIKNNDILQAVGKVETNGTWSLTNETLNVDNVDTTCRHVSITNIQNINVSPGTTYYIYLNCNYYQASNHNIAYPNTSKNAINFLSSEQWKLNVETATLNSNEYSETAMNNLKAEVNGVQI